MCDKAKATLYYYIIKNGLSVFGRLYTHWRIVRVHKLLLFMRRLRRTIQHTSSK